VAVVVAAEKALVVVSLVCTVLLVTVSVNMAHMAVLILLGIRVVILTYSALTHIVSLQLVVLVAV
jgi:hypothetical protein